MTPRTMDTLRPGEVGCVHAVHNGSAGRRLVEMGLVPQATVEMVRRGNPCIVRVNWTRLSLGTALQREVQVSSLRPDAPAAVI